jgi:hypothetical protein
MSKTLVSILVFVMTLAFMQLSANVSSAQMEEETVPVAGKMTAVCNIYCIQVDSAGNASLAKDFETCPSGSMIAIDTKAKVCYLVAGTTEKMASIAKMPSKKGVELSGELKGGQNAWILYVE